MATWTKDQADHRIELDLTGVHCMRTLHTWMKGWGESDGWQLLRLSLHEWAANMLQHASFEARRPRLAAFIKKVGNRVEAIIEDNSGGFDVHAVPQANFLQFPDRGMGITLLRMCSEHLDYTHGAEKNELFFSIPLRAQDLSVVRSQPHGVVTPSLPTAA